MIKFLPPLCAALLLVGRASTAPAAAQPVPIPKVPVKNLPFQIKLKNCDATTNNAAKPIHTQTDKKGNKLEIFCKDNQYQGKFTKADGTVAWFGLCKYPYGQNLIVKNINVTASVQQQDNGSVIMIVEPADTDKPDEITGTSWTNVDPGGPPPTTATTPPEVTGADVEWRYDPASNTLVTQKTKHKGRWLLPLGKDASKPENWVWIPIGERERDGEPKSAPAPDDPKKLLAAADVPREQYVRHATIDPGAKPIYYPVPITLLFGKNAVTYAFAAPINRPAPNAAVVLRGTEVHAVAGNGFSFQVRDLDADLGLVAFRLVIAPQGMSVDRSTGLIRWRPSRQQVGRHSVVLQRSYAGGTRTIDSFILTVRAAGGAPANASRAG